MDPVIGWAMVTAACIFGLGLISAIASRSQRLEFKRNVDSRKGAVQVIAVQPKVERPEMIMSAAHGLGNVSVTTDEAVFGGALVGTGQGNRS